MPLIKGIYMTVWSVSSSSLRWDWHQDQPQLLEISQSLMTQTDGCDGSKRGLTLTNCTGSGWDGVTFLQSRLFVFCFGSMTNRQHTHVLVLLSSVWTASGFLFSHSAPTMSRLGWARNWEWTQLGQPTWTDQRNVPLYRIMSSSANVMLAPPMCHSFPCVH